MQLLAPISSSWGKTSFPGQLRTAREKLKDRKVPT